MDRGFKPAEMDDEGKVVEDVEILEEKEDFDKEKHEIDVFDELFHEVN